MSSSSQVMSAPVSMKRASSSLGKRFAALETRKRPFAKQPPLHRPTTWLEPELVAEVKFSGWTPDGHLRAPVFLRMRDDIAASDVRGGPDGNESGGKPPRKDPGPASEIGEVLRQLDQKGNRIDLQVGSARIRLTNLDREYWPGGARGRPPPITKRDLLRYLARASPYLLTHLRNRPLTMIRMPEGIGGERFFQKHWRQERPEFVESVEVYSGSKDEEQEYLLANNLPTLLWLGQVGTLEFHVWHSRAEGGPDWKGKGTDYSSSLEALESLGAQLPRLPRVRHRPLHLFGQGSEGRRARAQQEGFRDRPASRFLAA